MTITNPTSTWSTTDSPRVTYDLQDGTVRMTCADQTEILDLHEAVTLTAVLRNQVAGAMSDQGPARVYWAGRNLTLVFETWRGARRDSAARVLRGLDQAVENLWPLHRTVLSD